MLMKIIILMVLIIFMKYLLVPNFAINYFASQMSLKRLFLDKVNFQLLLLVITIYNLLKHLLKLNIA